MGYMIGEHRMLSLFANRNILMEHSYQQRVFLFDITIVYGPLILIREREIQNDIWKVLESNNWLTLDICITFHILLPYRRLNVVGESKCNVKLFYYS